MVKTLENNLINNMLKTFKIGTLALLASASLSFIDCKPHVDPTPEPEDSSIKLENVNLTQGENKTIDLLKDSSDAQAIWTGIASYDSNLLTPTLIGNNLTVQVSDNVKEDTPYSVSLKVKNGDKEETAVLEGIVKNVFEIRGVIQNNETHTNTAGVVKIFDSSNNKVGECSTSDGNFYIKPSSLSSGSKVELQAKFNGSYVRTVEFNIDNTKDISTLVRVVPNVNFDIDDSGVVDATDNQKFIDFIKQINTATFPDSEGLYRIKKWNLDNLLAIEICRTNLDNGIAMDIEATNFMSYIPKITNFIGGKKDLSSIIQVLENSSLSHKGQPGYITIIPDNSEGTKGGIGLTELSYQDLNNSRIITSSIVHLLTAKNITVDYHEAGHVFIAPVGEANSSGISPKYTIMFTSGNILIAPGLADEKAGKLLYEETYSAGEKLENILGINFLDNSS
jgi:hypothetical protein